jgi:hypothetical protein
VVNTDDVCKYNVIQSRVVVNTGDVCKYNVIQSRVVVNTDDVCKYNNNTATEACFINVNKTVYISFYRFIQAIVVSYIIMTIIFIY